MRKTVIYLQNTDLHKLIKKQAAEEGLTISKLVENVLLDYVNRSVA